MPDLIKSIMQAFQRESGSSEGLAQDRYMRTPIFIQPQAEGVGAHYESQGNPSEVLARSIGAGNNPALSNLVNEWKGKQGLISAGVGDPQFGPSIQHEVAHRIYDLAGLGNQSSQLLPFVPKTTADWIKKNPLYSSMDYGGSPAQITNEGLGYAFNSPAQGNESYVQKVASLIKDPNLKNTLIRMFANRQK